MRHKISPGNCRACLFIYNVVRDERDKKMSSSQYRNSHCGDKTILRSSYLHNENSYTDKIFYTESGRKPVACDIVRYSQCRYTAAKGRCLAKSNILSAWISVRYVSGVCIWKTHHIIQGHSVSTLCPNTACLVWVQTLIYAFSMPYVPCINRTWWGYFIQ